MFKMFQKVKEKNMITSLKNNTKQFYCLWNNLKVKSEVSHLEEEYSFKIKDYND